MTHLESRPSKSNPGIEYDFYVECCCTDQQKQELVEKLTDYANKVNVLSRDPSEDEGIYLRRGTGATRLFSQHRPSSLGV